MEDIIWKSVKGYEGIYEVSNHGRVRSLTRIDCIGALRQGKLLTTNLDSDGYSIKVFAKDRKNTSVRVHRIIAQTFISNPNNLPQINHKDGNKLNNHVDNLEWVTAKENIVHAVSEGLRDAKGENNYGCVLNENQVIDIYRSNLRCNELSQIYGVSPLAINRIKIGKTWSHLTGHQYKQKRPSTFLNRLTVLSIFNDNRESKEIANDFSTKPYVVNMIKRGQSYSQITGKKHYAKKRK